MAEWHIDLQELKPGYNDYSTNSDSDFENIVALLKAYSRVAYLPSIYTVYHTILIWWYSAICDEHFLHHYWECFALNEQFKKAY